RPRRCAPSRRARAWIGRPLTCARIIKGSGPFFAGRWRKRALTPFLRIARRRRPYPFPISGRFVDNSAPHAAPRKRQLMNLHEYQSKALFAEYGIPIPEGRVAASEDEATKAA